MTATSQLPQNLVPNDPELKDLVDLLRKQVKLEINCHAIATIQSFDPTTQTAKATVNYKKTFFQPNAATGVYDPVLVDYPVLTDCPAIVLGGGGGALTFPIASGDECLVLFNDRDLDNWFQGNSGAAVATPRLHSFSDGIILVGLRSLGNALTGYNATAVELRSKTDLVLKAGAALTTTFKEDGKIAAVNAAGDLITAIYQLFTTATAGGFPLIPDPTNLAILASFKP